MTTTAVAIDGFITDAHLLSPKTDFFGSKFELMLQPDNYYLIEELEARAEDFKRENENYWKEEWDARDDENYTTYKDQVVDGCNIYFQTLHQPSVRVKDVEENNQLIGKFVRALGHIKQMKGGNIYVSMHEIYEVPLPNVDEMLDFLDDEDDGW